MSNDASRLNAHSVQDQNQCRQESGGSSDGVGPASPVRDSAPPDQKAFSESEAVLLDLIAQYGQASFTEGRHFDADPEYDAPQDERSSGLWRAILPAVRGVRDPQPELGNDIRRLKIALAAAISALKAGEPWHYSGCAGCAEIEAAMIGGPPPKETPQ